MKKGISLFLVFVQLVSFAQSEMEVDYMVINAQDTLYGKVRHIDNRKVNTRHLKKIELTNAKGKKRKYKRANVSAFRVDNKIYEGFWLHQTSETIQFINPKYSIDSENGEKEFLRVITKGKLSHYQLEWFEQGESRRHYMDLLKRESDDFFIRATQGLFGLKRKVLKTYFSACPELSSKIHSKEIKKMAQLMKFYNDNCLN